jgi:large subunit ribosomal protein L4
VSQNKENREAAASVACALKDSKGKDAGSVELKGDIFGAAVTAGSAELVHETIRWQRARRRSGTHQTLTRTMMRGGQKKPFKQKGTGRARAGSTVSPLMVGGAIVFGPQPRNYDFRLPKRQRRQALVTALSEKAAANKIVVFKELQVSSGKTKDMVELLKTAGVDAKAVLLFAGTQREAQASAEWKACQNIPTVKPLAVEGLNVYDLIGAQYVVTTEEAIKQVEVRLTRD